jgi:hypothetical protein
MPNPDSSRGGNAPRLDTGDDLLTHDTLAGLSVLAGGPASPQAADHGRQRSAKPARQASDRPALLIHLERLAKTSLHIEDLGEP